jgi:hypothetical protein
LLSLALSSTFSFANPLSVPVRTTYVEYTGWGEAPSVVADVVSADVALSNAATGASFGVDGELVVTDRTAAGKGELQFDANASGSLHTWAVWALDANGMPLSEKPEIIDVLFGNDEDGAIVARADGTSLIKTLRVKNRTAPGEAPEDGTHTVRVVVRDTGIQAAYLGIQELASDGVALSTHVDMEAMTADVYATFQGKMFDALVPLDTWTAVVEGNVDVTGLAISTGGIVEEGADLDWDIQFFAAKTAEKPALDATYLIGTQSYAQKIRKLKAKNEKGFEAFRVALDPTDTVYDVYDASLTVILDQAAGDFELGAILTPAGNGAQLVTDTLLVFDPTEVRVVQEVTDWMKYPSTDTFETYTVSFVGLDADDKPNGTKDICTLTPTAKSTVEGGKTLRWTGECMRDDDGSSNMGSVVMKLTSASELTITFEQYLPPGDGPTAPPTVETWVEAQNGQLLLSRKRAKHMRTWGGLVVPWTFPSDVTGEAYVLDLSVYGATEPPQIELEGGGWYDWGFDDPTWTIGEDETGVYARGVTTGTATRIARTP